MAQGDIQKIEDSPAGRVELVYVTVNDDLTLSRIEEAAYGLGVDVVLMMDAH